jgi:hypothetical protein
MLRELINDAKTAAASLVATYLARASVVVPFIAAAGFATAAITFLLVERFGPIAGCAVVAAGFTVIGMVATLLVTIKEQEEAAEAEAEAEEENAVTSAIDAVEQVVTQSPIELAGALLLSTPLGPRLLAAGANAAGRNLPILVLIVLISTLLWTENLDSGRSQPEAGDSSVPPMDVAWPEDREQPQAA